MATGVFCSHLADLRALRFDGALVLRMEGGTHAQGNAGTTDRRIVDAAIGAALHHARKEVAAAADDRLALV